MRCTRLDSDFLFFLEVETSKERARTQKKDLNVYPFGLKHKGYNNTPLAEQRDHKYGFGGKEEQGELGLEWMDFHARNYDAGLGRWMNIDPLAENFYSWSPFNYVYNSPLKFVDPTGMGAEDIIIRGKNTETGEYQTAYIIETSCIDAEIDVDFLPVIPTHDPLSNVPINNTPTVIKGFDKAIDAGAKLHGAVDAYTISISGTGVAGGGVSAQVDLGIITNGIDKGGVFMYHPKNPPTAAGLMLGVGVEAGAVFASQESQSTWNKTSLEGPTISLAGGIGIASATVSVGFKGYKPSTFGFSVGGGFSSTKVGGKAQYHNNKLATTLIQPGQLLNSYNNISSRAGVRINYFNIK